jgi:uncharacterized cofD-like protein
LSKKIVLLGGGHGLSNICGAFKDDDVSIIVSSSDDGGHTGKIRDEFGCVALGDLRMVLSELVDDPFLNYRFKKLHEVNNVSLGNLMLLSLFDKYDNVDLMLDEIKKIFKIKPNIYLSTSNPVTLHALCEDGSVIDHERIIGESNAKIENLFVDKAFCNEKMIEKILEADLIVLCPGSLYTSIGSVLCVDDIKKAIQKSSAKIMYICNIMTQNGETLGFNACDHVEVLEKIMDKKIDKVIINKEKIPLVLLNKYIKENSEPVSFDNLDDDRFEFHNMLDLKGGNARHSSKIVREIIFNQA